ncbi:MAG: hypothetical protein WCA44_18055 [Acidobacteriaceae bacterium]
MKVSQAVAGKVVSDKKAADFQWREWCAAAEQLQDLYRRASVSQKLAKIALGDGKRPVCLLPFSDQHIGSRGTTYKIFRRMTEEILADPQIYIAVIGDLAEFAIKLRSVAEICAQIFSPEKQMQFVEDWFAEIAPKVAFCSWGNHEDERTEKQAGFGAMKWLMAKRAVYFDGIGHADVQVGKQVYRIAASHKFRGYSYMNACHAGQRYMRFQGVDREIAVMGDIHTPAFLHYYDGPMERVSLVAGTLNVSSLYAERYFSIFTQPEYPCLILDHEVHAFDCYANLAAWKRCEARSKQRR